MLISNKSLLLALVLLFAGLLLFVSPVQAENGAAYQGVTENSEPYVEGDDEGEGVLASILTPLRAIVDALQKFVEIITSPQRMGEMLLFIIVSLIGLSLDLVLSVFGGIFARNFLLMESMSHTPWAITLWGYLWWLSLAFWGIAILSLASRFIQGKEVPGQNIRAFSVALMLNFMSLWLTELLISLLNQLSWSIIEPAVQQIGLAFGESDLSHPFSQNLIFRGFIGDLGEGGDGTMSAILLKGDWMNALPMFLIMTALIVLGLAGTLKFIVTRFLLIFSPYYLIRIGFFDHSLETLAGFLNLYARTYSLQLIFCLTWIMCYRLNRSLAETGLEQTGGLAPDILTGIILWTAVFVIYKFWFVHARESAKHLVTHLGGEQVLKTIQERYDYGMRVLRGLPRAGLAAGAEYAARKGRQIGERASEALQNRYDEWRMERLYETGKLGMTPLANVKLSEEIRARFDPEVRKEKEMLDRTRQEYWEYSDRLVKGYIYYDEFGNAVIADKPPENGVFMGSWRDRKNVRKAREKARERNKTAFDIVQSAKEEAKQEVLRRQRNFESYSQTLEALRVIREELKNDRKGGENEQ